MNEILFCETCGAARGWLRCACEYPCRACGAQPGQKCMTNVNKPLRDQHTATTYHGIRWRDAAESGSTQEVAYR